LPRLSSSAQITSTAGCRAGLGRQPVYGAGLGGQVERFETVDGGLIFAYQLANPAEYGVVEFGEARSAISLEEKPAQPESSFAAPGLYFTATTSWTLPRA